MSVNLIEAGYEELRGLSQIGHASATHIIDIRNECNLQKVPFTFHDLAGKPTIQTAIGTLLRGGQCYFEGQPLPFELEDKLDDGDAVGGVATADDKDSETQGNQPTKSPKSASQKKSPRGSLAMSKPVRQPEPQRPTRDDEILSLMQNMTISMKDIQKSMREMELRQDSLESWRSSVLQGEATQAAIGPDVRPRVKYQVSAEAGVSGADRSSRRDEYIDNLSQYVDERSSSPQFLPPGRNPHRQQSDQRQDSWEQNGRVPSSNDSGQNVSADRGRSERHHKEYIPKLKYYDGKECFQAWLKKFENFRRHYRWDDDDSLFYLVGLLIEEASEFYEDLHPDVQDKYASTTQALLQMFSKKATPAAKKAELNSIRQGEGKNIDEFKKRIKILVHQAYPRMGQEVINNQGLHAFLRGCSDIQAAEIALIREPTTLDEAADYTKIAVSNHSMLMEFHRDKKPKTRQVTFADEYDICQVQKQPKPNENQPQKDSFSEVL